MRLDGQRGTAGMTKRMAEEIVQCCVKAGERCPTESCGRHRVPAYA